jgi:hypothetical protein
MCKLFKKKMKLGNGEDHAILKEIVISLIVDDLKLCKHFQYLCFAGLENDRMGLNLHLNIFSLIGFCEITEQLTEWCFRQSEKMMQIEISNTCPEIEKIYSMKKGITIAFGFKNNFIKD